MQKGEALERLCKLIDSVREDVFCNQQEGDCICGCNPHVSHPVIGEGVMTFIERAVTQAIQTEVDTFEQNKHFTKERVYKCHDCGDVILSCPKDIETKEEWTIRHYGMGEHAWECKACFQEDEQGCPQVGTGGSHSDSYGEDGDGRCQWCGQTPNQ